MKPTDSTLTDTKTFPTSFKQDGPFEYTDSFFHGSLAPLTLTSLEIYWESVMKYGIGYKIIPKNIFMLE